MRPRNSQPNWTLRPPSWSSSRPPHLFQSSSLQVYPFDNPHLSSSALVRQEIPQTSTPIGLKLEIHSDVPVRSMFQSTKIFVLTPKDAKTVADVKSHVATLLNISSSLFHFCNGEFRIPDEEVVDIFSCIDQPISVVRSLHWVPPGQIPSAAAIVPPIPAQVPIIDLQTPQLNTTQRIRSPPRETIPLPCRPPRPGNFEDKPLHRSHHRKRRGSPSASVVSKRPFFSTGATNGVQSIVPPVNFKCEVESPEQRPMCSQRPENDHCWPPPATNDDTSGGLIVNEIVEREEPSPAAIATDLSKKSATAPENNSLLNDDEFLPAESNNDTTEGDKESLHWQPLSFSNNLPSSSASSSSFLRPAILITPAPQSTIFGSGYNSLQNEFSAQGSSSTEDVAIISQNHSPFSSTSIFGGSFSAKRTNFIFGSSSPCVSSTDRLHPNYQPLNKSTENSASLINSSTVTSILSSTINNNNNNNNHDLNLNPLALLNPYRKKFRRGSIDTFTFSLSQNPSETTTNTNETQQPESESPQEFRNSPEIASSTTHCTLQKDSEPQESTNNSPDNDNGLLIQDVEKINDVVDPIERDLGSSTATMGTTGSSSSDENSDNGEKSSGSKLTKNGNSGSVTTDSISEEDDDKSDDGGETDDNENIDVEQVVTEEENDLDVRIIGEKKNAEIYEKLKRVRHPSELKINSLIAFHEKLIGKKDSEGEGIAELSEYKWAKVVRVNGYQLTMIDLKPFQRLSKTHVNAQEKTISWSSLVDPKIINWN